MKTRLLTCFLFLLLADLAWADVVQTQNSATATGSSSEDRNYSVVEGGAHYLIWEADDTNAGSMGAVNVNPAVSLVRRRHRVVEIASGMNYWDGQQWSPSEPSFEVTSNGFVAAKVYHRIQLANDISAPSPKTSELEPGTATGAINPKCVKQQCRLIPTFPSAAPPDGLS